MGVQVELQDIQSGYLSAAAHTANNTLIEEGLNKALDRTASTDNAMAVNLDMGNNRLINLANGILNSDAVTLSQLNGAISAAGSGLIASQRETQTGADAVASVTTFAGITYTVGGNNLFVFRNGVMQTKDVDYTETSTSSITWLVTLNATDDLLFITNLATTNSVTNTGAVSHVVSGTTLNLQDYLNDRRSYVDIREFGGIEGTDIGNASTNSAALLAAINAVADPTVNGIDGGGVVDLGQGHWVFGPTTIYQKWGWVLKGNMNKVKLTGEFTLGGCAYFAIDDVFLQAETVQTYNALSLGKGGGSERCHNFRLRPIQVADFATGIVTKEFTSQGDIYGEYSGNLTDIDIQSGGGGEHIKLRGTTHASHTGSTASLVKMNGVFSEMIGCSFETLRTDPSYVDIEIGGNGCKVIGGVMTESGGISITSGFGSIEGLVISNSSASVVINHTGVVGDWDIINNVIRWSFNNGTGTSFTDGTGKTGIKTTVGLGRCAGNRIRRADVGIHSTAASVYQQFEDNKLIDFKTDGYLLDNCSNTTISGGQLELGASAKGIRCIGASAGNGNLFDNISMNGAAANLFDFSVGGANSVIKMTRTGTPYGVIPGGLGSEFVTTSAPNGVVRYTNLGPGINGWVREGSLQATTAELESITSSVNTDGKKVGQVYYNTTTGVRVYATGSTAGAVWRFVTSDATAHTPV